MRVLLKCYPFQQSPSRARQQIPSKYVIFSESNSALARIEMLKRLVIKPHDFSAIHTVMRMFTYPALGRAQCFFVVDDNQHTDIRICGREPRPRALSRIKLNSEESFPPFKLIDGLNSLTRGTRVKYELKPTDLTIRRNVQF